MNDPRPAPQFDGLVAAGFSPMHADGALDLGRVPALVEHVLAGGCVGLYVCGSTGEGPSLTGSERRSVAEAYVAAVANRVPVIVQVGHDSLAEGRALARHASEIGASAISALPPTYFAPRGEDAFLGCLEELASGAPELPFFYYHIPELSGVARSMLELVEHSVERLPSLAGIKYTAPTLDEFQACLDAAGDRLQFLFGRDEMLLAALAVGTRGAIGSTYNFLAPVYQRLIAAFRSGDLETARAEQRKSHDLIRLIPTYGRGALKAMMGILGVDCGPSRLPHEPLDDAARARLRADLEGVGALDWVAVPTPATRSAVE